MIRAQPQHTCRAILSLQQPTASCGCCCRSGCHTHSMSLLTKMVIKQNGNQACSAHTHHAIELPHMHAGRGWAREECRSARRENTHPNLTVSLCWWSVPSVLSGVCDLVCELNKRCAACVAVRATAGALRESACLYVCVKGEGFRWWDWQSSAHPSHQSSCPWTPSCSFRHTQCLSLSIFMISAGMTDPNLKWALLLGVGGAVVALVGGVSHNGDQVCAAG